MATSYEAAAQRPRAASPGSLCSAAIRRDPTRHRVSARNLRVRAPDLLWGSPDRSLPLCSGPRGWSPGFRRRSIFLLLRKLGLDDEQTYFAQELQDRAAAKLIARFDAKPDAMHSGPGLHEDAVQRART